MKYGNGNQIEAIYTRNIKFHFVLGYHGAYWVNLLFSCNPIMGNALLFKHLLIF